MKRNTLTTAVLAGLTGMAGMVSVSNAVNVNPDGLGQVLLYPYYTTRGGNDTMISVVNTTSRGKAVKIRFIEALNSREVLDFNIYMSEWDVWVAAITDSGAGGAQMITPDNTCTVPYFAAAGGVEQFVDYLYAGAATNDRGPQSLDRTRSGYIEVIEMGVLGVDEVNGQDVEAAARHHTSGPMKGQPPLSGSNGSNTNIQCGLFQERWIRDVFDNGNGIWREIDSNRGIEPPIGGLFGNAAIINNTAGTMFSYEATALDNFWGAEQINHTRPEDVTPSLNSSNNTSSVVFISGMTQPQQATWFNSIDAVNHVLAYNSLMNEYNVNPGLAAQSEWVVTFPTKRQHVDAADGGLIVGAAAAIPPFTQLWTNTSPVSCEVLDLDVWDREEQNVRFTTDGEVCPSPRPIDPGTGLPIPCEGDIITFALCREANVIRFGAEDVPAPGVSEILGEPSGGESLRPEYGYVNFPLPTSPYPYMEGWARINFDGFASRLSTEGSYAVGLPAIGFWVNTYTNDAVADGVLANFGASFQHRGSRYPLQMVSPQ
jgi:hypothetical protein